MNFDFSKFATMTANTVESAFSEKPQSIIADIANEIAMEEQKQEVKQEVNAPVLENGVSALSAEEIAKQAQFLKEQKAKSDAKEDSATNEAVKGKDTKAKKDAKAKKDSKPKKEEEKPVVFSRPRRVVAYGDLVYIEEDTTKTLEDIRATLVNTYGYSEFRESTRCTMVFDAKTGEVYPEISFKKKG